MAIRLLTSADDLQRYDAWVSSHPQGTLWQSVGWKTHQEALGRTVKIYADEEAGKIVASALVVIDKTAGGLSTWEMPRGPVWVTSDECRVSGLLDAICRDAQKNRCLSVFLSPLESLSRHSTLDTRHSCRHIHPEATRILDLTANEEALLASMKQKGRYNVRLAEKHGVIVRTSGDVEAFAALMDETAQRDGFRPSGSRIYRSFLQNVPGSFLLLAYASAGGEQGKTPSTPIAGLIGAMWGTTGLPAEAGSKPAKVGIYYYGASDHAHRDLMAPYLLQWEAMKHCKAAGCTSYDLFGIAPDGDIEHPWAGVSEFKAKFGGTVVNYPPEQEIILRPVMKKLLQMKRTIIG